MQLSQVVSFVEECFAGKAQITAEREPGGPFEWELTAFSDTPGTLAVQLLGMKGEVLAVFGEAARSELDMDNTADLDWLRMRLQAVASGDAVEQVWLRRGKPTASRLREGARTVVSVNTWPWMRTPHHTNGGQGY